MDLVLCPRLDTYVFVFKKSQFWTFWALLPPFNSPTTFPVFPYDLLRRRYELCGILSFHPCSFFSPSTLYLPVFSDPSILALGLTNCKKGVEKRSWNHAEEWVGKFGPKTNFPNREGSYSWDHDGILKVGWKSPGLLYSNPFLPVFASWCCGWTIHTVSSSTTLPPKKKFLLCTPFGISRGFWRLRCCQSTGLPVALQWLLL